MPSSLTTEKTANCVTFHLKNITWATSIFTCSSLLLFTDYPTLCDVESIWTRVFLNGFHICNKNRDSYSKFQSSTSYPLGNGEKVVNFGILDFKMLNAYFFFFRILCVFLKILIRTVFCYTCIHTLKNKIYGSNFRLYTFQK